MLVDYMHVTITQVSKDTCVEINVRGLYWTGTKKHQSHTHTHIFHSQEVTQRTFGYMYERTVSCY